ncbi:MAG: hypothetical protein LBG18_05595, partial [Mediterranea sp.]|nr:hypothetical protein [Mediterranea sp.]
GVSAARRSYRLVSVERFSSWVLKVETQNFASLLFRLLTLFVRGKKYFYFFPILFGWDIL